MYEDNIAAITTVLGPSSIGAIRISGPDAITIADRVFIAKSGKKLKDRPTYTITYGRIVDENNKMVDEALALIMLAPKSFTGENIVELQCHGGMIVLRKTLELILNAGAKLAEPGEFSKRAFINGKMDLSQAEAIMDIINAKTEIAAEAALNNLQGTISIKINDIRQNVMEIIAYLEAEIDFPEEEIPRLSYMELEKRLKGIEEEITSILETFKSGRIIREGLKTVLIGKPNVGKSSLLNVLLNERRAIVTDVPGTTRDTIEEYYNLGGIPLVLIDTAGIRNTEDIVEKLGMEKTKEATDKADLILYIMDISEGVTAEDINIIEKYPIEKLLILVNKIDLNRKKSTEIDIKKELGRFHLLFISAKDRTGIRELEEKIKDIFFEQKMEITDKPFLTNVRQKDALFSASKAIINAEESVQKKMPLDFVSIDLRQAWISLGEVTGDTLSEDIIDQIFSKFCLGK